MIPWSLIAQTGLQIGSTLLQGSAASKEAKRVQDAQNESIKAYNKQVLQKSAQDISSLNVNKSISRMKTTQALYAVQRQAVEEKSQRKTQLAATDTAGASARQALQAVDTAKDQATSMYMLNQELTEDQINANISSTVANATNSLQRLRYGGTAVSGSNTSNQLLEIGANSLASFFSKKQ